MMLSWEAAAAALGKRFFNSISMHKFVLYFPWQVSWGNEGESFCRWSGTLVTEGGGFCGTVVRSLPFSTAGFDGMSLLVRGDGNRYKVDFNLPQLETFR